MNDAQEGKLQIKESFSLMKELYSGLSAEQLKVIKNTLAPKMTDAEIMVTLYKAHKLGLDWLNGELSAYPSGEGENRKLVFIVQRDGKRVSAERTGKLEYIQSEAIYTKKIKDTDGTERQVKVEPWEGGDLWGARAVGKRKDRSEPATVVVKFSEYNTGYNVWKSKPETMIKKVAESQLLSMLFSHLAGTYDEAEQWDEPQNPAIIASPEDNEPVSEVLKATLKSVNIEVTENMTNREAKEKLAAIAQSVQKKGRK